MKQIAYWMAALMFLLAGPVAASAQTTASPVVENITVHAPSVEGNLEGNSADRQVFVILPPSYASSPRRHYPVVYFLHGYLSTAQGYMDHFALAEGTAKAFRNGAKEMIVVVPDSDTRHGGSYYASSPTVGDFGTFIARDLVGYIDQHYRTIASREGRALSGWSMGGDASLRFAFKYPDMFCAAATMSAAIDWGSNDYGNDSVKEHSRANADKVRDKLGILMVVGEDVTELAAGDPVDVMMLP